ncbi:MAG: hypothetical protein GY859_24360, partial [Desulfobacterales bacterium]|nr:hypothetical protein [Desulfobacterales bacterium]
MFGAGQRIARVDSTGVRYFHQDHLSSMNAVTDDNGGSLRELAHHMPHGEIWGEGSIGETVKYKFTDQELDTTELYNYGARLYDPALARFISPDSIIPDLYDPQMLNRYAYARNN